jgi:hypothetical protein
MVRKAEPVASRQTSHQETIRQSRRRTMAEILAVIRLRVNLVSQQQKNQMRVHRQVTRQKVMGVNKENRRAVRLAQKPATEVQTRRAGRNWVKVMAESLAKVTHLVNQEASRVKENPAAAL